MQDTIAVFTPRKLRGLNNSGVIFIFFEYVSTYVL